ncbi:MAG: hypothetical protein M1377_03270 [Deltaproteobacteria bacterium]|nr:hypothetical protein [Deltaproteobacteria bacterium]MDA8179250.1 hypothetical protein [Deltaproteobacteria bacterium]
MREKTPLLFDSHALLKLFQKEAGQEKVARMLTQAIRVGTPKYLNAINLGEILYSTKRAFGDQKKIEVLKRGASVMSRIVAAAGEEGRNEEARES